MTPSSKTTDPAPKADLLYLWQRHDGQWVLTIVAAGKSSEFEMSPAKIARMISEAAIALTK